jgi:hypothetical protein
MSRTRPGGRRHTAIGWFTARAGWGPSQVERHQGRDRHCRGQSNLIALGAALLALTTAAGLGLALADAALAGADRQPLDRAAAEGAADRLVAADAATTRRANVLDETAMQSLNATRLEAMAPAVEDRDVRVRLDGQSLVERGTPEDGVTIRRIVLVAEQTEATRSIDLGESDSVTLPRRTVRVRLAIDPAADTAVETVRADGRVVLHDRDGLAGTATVSVSRYETTTLAFETRGDGSGSVAVTYYPTQANKAVLEVSVDG